MHLKGMNANGLSIPSDCHPGHTSDHGADLGGFRQPPRLALAAEAHCGYRHLEYYRRGTRAVGPASKEGEPAMKRVVSEILAAALTMAALLFPDCPRAGGFALSAARADSLGAAVAVGAAAARDGFNWNGAWQYSAAKQQYPTTASATTRSASKPWIAASMIHPASRCRASSGTSLTPRPTAGMPAAAGARSSRRVIRTTADT